MARRVPIDICQRRLATLWLAGAAATVFLVAAQTIGGRYGNQADDAWTWLTTLVSPMLLLIVGAVFAEARRPQNAATVDRFAYRLSLGLSGFYLFLLLGTILVQPLVPFGPFELLTTSNLWLGPLQGFVAMALGVFFQSKEADVQRVAIRR